MSSNIDPTVFPDNQQVTKTDLRQQFQIAHDEITTLQANTSLARRMWQDDNQWNTV